MSYGKYQFLFDNIENDDNCKHLKLEFEKAFTLCKGTGEDVDLDKLSKDFYNKTHYQLLGGKVKSDVIKYISKNPVGHSCLLEKMTNDLVSQAKAPVVFSHIYIRKLLKREKSTLNDLIRELNGFTIRKYNMFSFIPEVPYTNDLSKIDQTTLSVLPCILGLPQINLGDEFIVVFHKIPDTIECKEVTAVDAALNNMYVKGGYTKRSSKCLKGTNDKGFREHIHKPNKIENITDLAIFEIKTI